VICLARLFFFCLLYFLQEGGEGTSTHAPKFIKGVIFVTFLLNSILVIMLISLISPSIDIHYGTLELLCFRGIAQIKLGLVTLIIIFDLKKEEKIELMNLVWWFCYIKALSLF